MFYHVFSTFYKVRGAVVPHTSNVHTVRGAGPHIENQCAGDHYTKASLLQ